MPDTEPNLPSPDPEPDDPHPSIPAPEPGPDVINPGMAPQGAFAKTAKPARFSKRRTK
jgi:hypothetical protein